ncbi:MAG: hypothetical protein U0790_19965 [Isosphaeraceae bacterium]
MRKPRLRFREFFLLTTLASLIAASFAIRARTAALLSAPDYAFLAYWERASANGLDRLLREAKRKVQDLAGLSPDLIARYDVRLIHSSTILDLPTTGKELVVLGHYDGGIFFRIFDGEGGIVIDWVDDPGRIGASEEQLASLDPPHELTTTEKGWVIAAVTSLVDSYRSKLQAGIVSGKAEHAETLARAEYYERLARRP